MAIVRQKPAVTNLRVHAAREIRQMIYGGRLPRGVRVDQQRLARDLGMSLLPVREALTELHAEGLVRRNPHRGVYVSPLTRRDIRDTFELFGHVAGLAADRAASNIDPNRLRRLTELQDELERSEDIEDQERLNYEFHRMINVASASPRLLSTLRLLGQGMPSGFYETHEEWRPLAQADHRAILAAMAAGDGPAAREALRDHLSRSADQAIEFLEASGFWSDDD